MGSGGGGFDRDGVLGWAYPALNCPTRSEAVAHVRDRLLDHVAHRRRVLVGFDFPYGYPAGSLRHVLAAPVPADPPRPLGPPP